MRQKRRAWTRAIDKAKMSHWKQFLDEAGEGKLWKSALYMKPRDSWGCIPTLKAGADELTSNEDEAQAFMETFFPKVADAQEQPPTQIPPEIPCQPITELEVYRSLKAAKGSTAPGEDGLPTLVWKRLWMYLESTSPLSSPRPSVLTRCRLPVSKRVCRISGYRTPIVINGLNAAKKNWSAVEGVSWLKGLFFGCYDAGIQNPSLLYNNSAGLDPL